MSAYSEAKPADDWDRREVLNAAPVISCLCVSRGNERFLKRAIQQYCSQTWKRKELVLVVDDAPTAKQWLARYLEQLGRGDIKVTYIPPLGNPPMIYLGIARNVSVQAADGDILCQWDDDDLYHPDRLSVQCNDLLQTGADVSYLGDQLHYFEDSGELFWTCWHDPGIPGTLMCTKKVGLRYDENINEDSFRRNVGEDALLQKQLIAKCKVRILRGKGDLYAYVFHGSNTWARDHHYWCARNLGYDSSYLEEQKTRLSVALDAYSWENVPTTILSREGIPTALPKMSRQIGAPAR